MTQPMLHSLHTHAGSAYERRTPILVFCAGGDRKFADLAIRHGFAYGAQLPDTVYAPLYFADQDFKRPRYYQYVQSLKKQRPYLASVLDWMEARRFEEIMMRAEEIAQYCSEVMIIPKVIGGVSRIPESINGKPIRLGYSVPTGFGGTEVPGSEFGKRPVHLLGAEPGEQMVLAKSGLNVASVDGNYHKLKAKWANFWTGYAIKKDKPVDQWRQLQDVGLGHLSDAMYHAFRLSCINIKAWWSGSRCTVRYATDSDIPEIVKIGRQFDRNLGFIPIPKLKEATARQEIFIAQDNGETVGFLNYHLRRDGWSTVYEFAVHRDYHGKGVGRALFGALTGPVRLKCTTDNPANGFYEHQGLTLARTEPGRKRQVNVWERVAA